MKGREKILIDRILFCVFGALLVIFLAVLYSILTTDSDYSACLDRVESSAAELPAEDISVVEQPEDSYMLSTINFCGTCTTASMLGSHAYGTFNRMLSENGAAFFLEELSGIFGTDNATVAGCAAVISDSDGLVPAEKDDKEWYLAPSSAAEIFSLGGIDALSVECTGAGDYGETGLADTKASLEAESVVWGSADRIIELSLADGTVGAVCCAQYTEGSEESIIDMVSSAAGQYDFTALYVTDTSDSTEVSGTKRDAYRAFADAGADVVAASNGSCLQPIEEWNGRTIAYSLGALIDGSTKYPEKYTAVLSVSIRINDGEVTDIICEPLVIETYSESDSWHPSVITGESEKNEVMSILEADIS